VATLGGKAIPVTAELLTGEEAKTAFDKMIDLTPVYDAYRHRTSRAIRVFRLRAQSSA
jgi:hypothetical protein